jgi:hypothetical protein
MGMSSIFVLNCLHAAYFGWKLEILYEYVHIHIYMKHIHIGRRSRCKVSDDGTA